MSTEPSLNCSQLEINFLCSYPCLRIQFLYVKQMSSKLAYGYCRKGINLEVGDMAHYTFILRTYCGCICYFSGSKILSLLFVDVFLQSFFLKVSHCLNYLSYCPIAEGNMILANSWKRLKLISYLFDARAWSICQIFGVQRVFCNYCNLMVYL